MELKAENLKAAYDGKVIVDGVSLTIPKNEFTVIIGPNGCGKSTLLKTLSRLLKPFAGSVLLDGNDINNISTKDIAKNLGLLPQSHTMPEGILVKDLVARGRFPHRSFLSRWSEADDRAVEEALAITGLEALSERHVEELSGGQRQRAWLATILAQETPLLLLDEPTTYLDLSHQLDVLDMISELPEKGRTVLAVLHDLNLSARYAGYMIAMKAGKIVAAGKPEIILTEELVKEIFGIECRIVPDIETLTPTIVPIDRRKKYKR